MAGSQSFSTDLSLGVLPEIDPKKDYALYNELTRLRGAVRNLAAALDSYTGGSTNAITTQAVLAGRLTTNTFRSTGTTIGFFSVSGSVQPTTGGPASTYVPGATPVIFHSDDSYDGYTLAQVVAALRGLGLLA